MAAVVRIKNNRFVRINLQNKDGRYFSLREIRKTGVLHGYIKGVVQTAYPVFNHNYYGKIRKIILVETRDDDDDNDSDDCLKFPIVMLGSVAEKCAEVKEGDFLLLENPFLELSHPQKPNLQIIGDKKCSDICIWNINNRCKLLVGSEEMNSCESDPKVDSELEDSANVHEDNFNDDMDVSMSVDNAAKTDTASGSTDAAISPRRTRSSDLPKISRSKSQRVTRSTSSRGSNPSAKESSQESKDFSASQSERHLTRSTTRKTKDLGAVSSPPPLRRNNTRVNESSQGSIDSSASQPERPSTRSAKIKPTNKVSDTSPHRFRANNISGKKSSQESTDSSAAQSGRHSSRSATRNASDNDSVSSPPRKRKRKFHLGPKGSSSSPSNSPELRNVVALEPQPRRSPRKEKTTTQTKGNNTKTAKTSPLKPTGEISGSSKNSPSTRINKVSSSKGAPSTESSQEHEDREAGELLINSQASTPSGTFSSKKKKCFGESDSTPETPRKKLQPKSIEAGNTIPNKRQTNVAGSPSKVNKDKRKSPQPNTANSAAVTFVDDEKVPEKCSSPSNKQANGARHKSGKLTQDAAVTQPSVNEQSTSGVAASSSTSSNAPAISTVTSNVSSTSTCSVTDVPSTSTSSSSVSTTSNNPPQSTSYTVPAPYTKISDVKINTMCDLYGVAKFFKPPWKSRGTDMCSVVVLADPSSEEPLECVMFKDVILLPQIRRVGDIVRLHRMNIKMYKDKLQAVSTRGFSALVFDGDINSPVTKEGARVNTGSFSFNEADKKVVQALREWRLTRPDLFEEAKFLTVSTVEADLYFDTVCQVKGMAKHNNIDCVVLRVTDGTEPKNEIRSCEDDDSYQMVLAVDSHNRPPVFDVFLYGEHAALVTTMDVKADTVLMLHNVHSIASQGGPGASLLDVLEPTLELCIHRGSEYGRGLAVLSPDSDDAQKLIQRLKQQGYVSPRKQS